ncbi:glycosyl transferase [Candidatus Methylacidiphilum fumarolicum]|uniref:Glycosyltransferase n=2 Tax=Candidatus Methylacidiphilum fumarolicum TaxID=591154 RepID=I0JYC9_METFB|nr:glycosyltransferase [Candidatus Methylacidiphilum fumarolicum]MBW6415970.1 glycosyltransferase [Candidatus Methylacidiphilum fumarolicum]TFE67257.1 glycosyl transferase [Candidatus Methylacidiphilum fumarolicum]TFE71768.1 glycosyl transferase [Candidatus Methylacidiphilum fumarolicum]TFE72752.1 glycosyl transferase [Candidatus Methylacidiphilum fumarolicum]TFE76258.1 glycosyl transferase [Candidatus Methylacidiphilum fumarolicum]
MHILKVICSLSFRHGGPTVACLNQARALADRGHKVTIYTTNDYDDSLLKVPLNQTYQNIKKDGYEISYFSLTFHSISLLRKYYFSIPLKQTLSETILKYDIIYIYSLYRFPPTITAYYARKYQIPYVINPHGSLDPFLFKKKRWIKFPHERLFDFPNLNHASAIHFTSLEEQQLVTPLKLKSPGIIIPLGIDVKQYRYLSKGHFRRQYNLFESKILLFFGRINFKKGLNLLIPAFSQIIKKHEDVTLILAGPDNEGYGKKVSKWINEYNLEKNVIFTGMITGEKKKALLADADVFILPSYTENFGIAVVEAMAAGIPVIISDKVNIWREVKEGNAGIVVSCNVQEIAKACIELLSDDTLRHTMGENGKIIAENLFSIENTAKKLEESFIEIIKKYKSKCESTT